MGRQNLRFRTSLKTVGLRPTTRKFFEKNLTKNFYLSLPNLGAGIKASRPPQTPPPKSGVRVMSRVATRQALGEKKLKFFPYPIPYEKGERPYAIPDLSGG